MSISGFLISGCSQDETGDPNKVVIQKVLDHQFTGPDKEFMDLLWNPKYKIVENGAERNPELDKYIEEVSNRYTFVAKVGYQKNGDEEKIINVEGLVLFPTKEEGKIGKFGKFGKFEYGNDNGLLDILRQ